MIVLSVICVLLVLGLLVEKLWVLANWEFVDETMVKNRRDVLIVWFVPFSWPYKWLLREYNEYPEPEDNEQF